MTTKPIKTAVSIALVSNDCSTMVKTLKLRMTITGVPSGGVPSEVMIKWCKLHILVKNKFSLPGHTKEEFTNGVNW